ncbi:amidase [Vulcanococcus limneticus Candia 3F8]|uniref:amidase n=1 Tax=Vulcanococcus limneticus TaxID=2170428 RepID=UPI000B997712|nr:amidase [Vulcanococcus limneticus]MCP9793262.1 amidase [Vulcanococcus limneticus MW73D5]MCP9895278.1 amidase [Vulcanococcus limneticus Candia 3F8]MCP9898672.1 amidase [Vulcanococcus limneticus Candia 3B3]
MEFPPPPAAPASCQAQILQVLATITARNLSTLQGPPLNAFLSLNPSAVDQAAALDRARAVGTPAGPLHCLPLAVKDNIDTVDLPSTVGSLALLGNQPSADAPMVVRLRAAGAIVVGKTNMDAFAFGIRGLSGSGGRVGNAYDQALSSGGSSAGSGVAVGAGFVPLALGSDNCGSLRIPAVYNGAVSLRPTQERFDATGLFPIGFVNGTPGLIARDVPLLERGLAVIGSDWRSQRATASGALVGRRVGVLVAAGREALGPTDPQAARQLDRARQLLVTAGAELVEGVRLADFDTRLDGSFVKGSAARIDALLARYPAPRRSWSEICGSGRIPPEWSPAECRSLFSSDPLAERRALRRMAANRQLVQEQLRRQRLDALLYLTDRQGAARAQPSSRLTCWVASLAGLPALALPIGLDGRGLPVGVELLGPAGADEQLVAMAAQLEQRRGPLSPPSLPPADPRLAALGPTDQNRIALTLGWLADSSRRGAALGDLEPARFRSLTQALVHRWPLPWGQPLERGTPAPAP